MPLIAFAQESFPMKDGKVVFEQIDSLQAISKINLFKKSKVWFVNIFKSAKDVIQINDLEAGQLIGKGNVEYVYTIF